MALESFGQDTAKMIDNAVKTCHDIILDDLFECQFQARQGNIWLVEPGEFEDGTKCVVIKLGVG